MLKMDNKLSKTVGQRINVMLALRNKKQKDLAAVLNVTDNTVSYYCGGSRLPNTSQIKTIADFLECSADFLLGLTETPTVDTNVRAICDYTGLSESAVKTLHTLNENRDNIFSGVPSEFTPIIDYLINDIGLKFNKDANGVITDTCRYKHDSIINALARYLYIHPDDDQSVYLTTNGKIFLDREKAFEENKGKTDINRVFIENSADLIRSTYYNNVINAIRVTKENYRGDIDGNNQKTQ